MRAARLNSIRSFVRWCGCSLQKQILSATSKERRCAGDLLGVMLMPSSSYLRVLAASARFGTSLVKEIPTTRSKDDGEIQKHPATCSCCTSSTARPHAETTRPASWHSPHHCPAVGVP